MGHAATGEVVVEFDHVVRKKPWNHAGGVSVEDIRRGDEGSKQLHGRMEAAMEFFE